MSTHCHAPTCTAATPASPVYRRVLCIALVVNATLFLVEVFASARSGSVSLLADAIDFFADAGNYAISLLVLGMAPMWRSRAALLKAFCMASLGLGVLARAAWSAYTGVVPAPATMGAVGLLALAANGAVATLLYAWREGDANMRSVWLCTRNDVMGNLAVLVAALGVWGTHALWPDLLVATGMASLALSGAWVITRQALREATVARLPGSDYPKTP